MALSVMMGGHNRMLLLPVDPSGLLETMLLPRLTPCLERCPVLLPWIMLPALDQKLVSRTVLTTSLITVGHMREQVSGACQVGLHDTILYLGYDREFQ